MVDMQLLKTNNILFLFESLEATRSYRGKGTSLSSCFLEFRNFNFFCIWLHRNNVGDPGSNWPFLFNFYYPSLNIKVKVSIYWLMLNQDVHLLQAIKTGKLMNYIISSKEMCRFYFKLTCTEQDHCHKSSGFFCGNF